ncbi:hypothetical protein NA57DRAFT_57071 [Rhizodiscina lignyota]|uniref:Uncharacterized protein n=1 Tax=Rhizodiscina lignyota TaxID=1504668 RepID=A0A9P4IAA3_9PEZI|nr:hypothetical protein NA57DRAFT_57071 [Rhizodiscina lignyota]
MNTPQETATSTDKSCPCSGGNKFLESVRHLVSQDVYVGDLAKPADRAFQTFRSFTELVSEAECNTELRSSLYTVQNPAIDGTFSIWTAECFSGSTDCSRRGFLARYYPFGVSKFVLILEVPFEGRRLFALLSRPITKRRATEFSLWKDSESDHHYTSVPFVLPKRLIPTGLPVPPTSSLLEEQHNNTPLSWHHSTLVSRGSRIGMSDSITVNTGTNGSYERRSTDSSETNGIDSIPTSSTAPENLQQNRPDTTKKRKGSSHSEVRQQQKRTRPDATFNAAAHRQEVSNFPLGISGPSYTPPMSPMMQNNSSSQPNGGTWSAANGRGCGRRVQQIPDPEPTSRSALDAAARLHNAQNTSSQAPQNMGTADRTSAGGEDSQRRSLTIRICVAYKAMAGPIFDIAIMKEMLGEISKIEEDITVDLKELHTPGEFITAVMYALGCAKGKKIDLLYLTHENHGSCYCLNKDSAGTYRKFVNLAYKLAATEAQLEFNGVVDHASS